MRLALYQPDIPQNLGAAIRIAACLNAPLEIVEPCGFPLTDRALKRAALDYGDPARVIRHAGWAAFRESRPGRIVLFTTRAEAALPDFAFAADDTLLFGGESRGAPEAVHAAADARVRIPMREGARSLNVINAAAIALYEALRQTGALAALA